jgi:hypothetical protein
MEKVLVVKEVPGMLNIGDVLKLDDNGNFFLSEENGKVSRYVNIDYVTVSDNIPEYFDYIFDLQESVCQECEDCDCIKPFTFRSVGEVNARLEFFQRQLDMSFPGSEAETVFTNLIWFIEWLKGEKNLLK